MHTVRRADPASATQARVLGARPRIVDAGSAAACRLNCRQRAMATRPIWMITVLAAGCAYDTPDTGGVTAGDNGIAGTAGVADDSGSGGSAADEPSAPASAQCNTTPTSWFDLELKLVKETAGFTPPVASRAFAYAGIALYEAVVHGMPGHRSLATVLTGLPSLPQPAAGKEYYWSAAANAALAAMMRDMFPIASAENLAAIDALETALAASYASEASGDVLARSAAYGRSIAAAIYAWSLSDGGDEGYLHNFPTSYTPPTGPGMWVPTPPAYRPAMLPYWGANRPFVASTISDCDFGAPPPYSETPGSTFYTQANEVYTTSISLSAEQRDIALFWSDDPGLTATPGGHSVSLTTQAVRANDAKLDVAAEAYAKVTIAVADAFISCWEGKFQFNLIRPVSYIDALIDPSWSPLIATPPFPEWPSGHSAQSGAAATVLTALFGVAPFTDHTHDARGLAPRSFASFDAAANEAAISRLYGGIHYRDAIEDGLDMGHCVGAEINALPLQ
jgi:hypothetical protein